MMSINPDAHSTRELDLTHWGVEMARKGGISKERVLLDQLFSRTLRTGHAKSYQRVAFYRRR